MSAPRRGSLLALCLIVAFAQTGAARSGPSRAGADTAPASADSAVATSTTPAPLVAGTGTALAAASPAGLRERLAARGVQTAASMTGLWIGDAAGGARRAGAFDNLGVVSVGADLAKITGGWKGAHAFADVYWINGRSPSREFVGDALVASDLDGFNSVRLYEAWLEQGAWADHASLRLGILGADDEFVCTGYGAALTNSAFGWCPGIGANVVNGGPIYFAPALGARLAIRPSPGWTLQAGAYDGDTFDSASGDPTVNAHGLHFCLSPAEGAFLIGELSHAWTGASPALPGCCRLDAWRHTAVFADQLRDAQGHPFVLSGLEPALHHGNQGVCGSLEQKIWNEPQDPGQGVGGWVRLAAAPADRSVYSWVDEAGLNWTGILPGRPADVITLGVTTADVSPDRIRQVLDANALDGGQRPVPDFERVVEAAYQIRWGDHWTVIPDLQWVQHPGTTRATPDATLASLRVSVQ